MQYDDNIYFLMQDIQHVFIIVYILCDYIFYESNFFLFFYL